METVAISIGILTVNTLIGGGIIFVIKKLFNIESRISRLEGHWEIWCKRNNPETASHHEGGS